MELEGQGVSPGAWSLCSCFSSVGETSGTLRGLRVKMVAPSERTTCRKELDGSQWPKGRKRGTCSPRGREAATSRGPEVIGWSLWGLQGDTEVERKGKVEEPCSALGLGALALR